MGADTSGRWFERPEIALRFLDETLSAELANHPRYRIKKRLGIGGMGTVYLAEHRLMDRLVALKVIRRDFLENEALVERFRREVKAAARLALHPNIVAAYDAEQAGDFHFLVMEFVDGSDLARHVESQGPMSSRSPARPSSRPPKDSSTRFKAAWFIGTSSRRT